MHKVIQKITRYAAPWQIVLMVIGFIVMTPIYIISLYILLSIYVISPTLEHFDKIKFDNLDSYSRSMFDKLSDASLGAEKWKYTKECVPQHDAWFATGEFMCTTKSRTQTNVTSASGVNNLNDKYFEVVESFSSLKAKDYAVFYPTTFGVKFQVSSIIKRYVYNSDNGLQCTYEIQLDQPDKDNVYTNYGDDITGNVGQVDISFTCEGIARGNWF